MVLLVGIISSGDLSESGNPNENREASKDLSWGSIDIERE
jgi:hypothetical protein